jgi:hypothetical protein
MNRYIVLYKALTSVRERLAQAKGTSTTTRATVDRLASAPRRLLGRPRTAHRSSDARHHRWGER